jgi:hypothetical protein
MIKMTRNGTSYDLIINGKLVLAERFERNEDIFYHLLFNKNLDLMKRYNIPMPNEKKLTLPPE